MALNSCGGESGAPRATLDASFAADVANVDIDSGNADMSAQLDPSSPLPLAPMRALDAAADLIVPAMDVAQDASADVQMPPLKLGVKCSLASDCESGHCVEGLCCDSACTGGCLTCATATQLGRCAPRPAYATPRDSSCTRQAVSTCGRTGFCDGSGGCALQDSGTHCAARACLSSSLLQPVRTCDGRGSCIAEKPIACAPYMCIGTTCSVPSCRETKDCPAGMVCRGFECEPRLGDTPCSFDVECRSGFCSRGVCCDRRCDGACEECVRSESNGLGACRIKSGCSVEGIRL